MYGQLYQVSFKCFFKTFNLFFFVLLIAIQSILSSCNRTVTPLEYLSKVGSDPDFVATWRGQELKATAVYRPSEWIALSEQREIIERSNNVNPVVFNRQKEEYKNTSYFIFTIGMNDGNSLLEAGLRNPQEHSIRLNYLTNSVSKDFYILTPDGEKIFCQLSEIQRNYGMSPDLTFVLGFPDKNLFAENGELTLVYEDNVLGLNTPVKLNFSTGKLSKRLPSIHI